MPEITPRSAGPAPLAAQEFSLWLRDAEPGEALLYHQGFLALDIDTVAPRRSAAARQGLLDLARLARLASEQGLVHLAQKRSEPGPFTYLAVKRPQATDDGTPVFAIYVKSPKATGSE